MEKPLAPNPLQFGIKKSDHENIPNFADLSVSHQGLWWSVALVVVAGELCWFAVSVSADNWQKHPLANVTLGLLLALPALIPAGIVAIIFWLAVDTALWVCWPKYASLTFYRKALKEHRVQVSAYEAWVKQEEMERKRKEVAFWKSLNGIAFERELGRLFQSVGFDVRLTPATADGGVDLILERDAQRTVVQCKAHASKVGISTARQLVASMIDFKAQGGILAVTDLPLSFSSMWG